MKFLSRWRGCARIAMLAVAGLAATAAQAQGAAWPARPVTLVVPFPAGGPTDVAARTVAKKLGESLGQPVIVENKAGAGGNIGASAVAHAAPDGYTLLVGTAAMTTSPHLFKKLSYDPFKDLTPIAMVATTPVFIWVDNRFPAKNLGEMMALLKARPGHYNYSSSAPATLAHLGSLSFFERAGIQALHLGYKGSSQAANDFLGGVFPIYFEVGQPVAPHMLAGKVRPLAVLSSRRSPLMPDVPSVAELGYPSIEAVPFVTLMAPTGTPQAIVDRLNAEARRALASADVRAKLASLYFDVADGGEPAAIAAWLRTESNKWGELIRRHDLKME